ncbi:MAG: CRISPR-associated endonuclease Cas3'' [Chloroflexota bacterium]|nr:MAG: CRISPR-associated endonuclease Cas3'' [Chloroflexota bacterium]
MPYAHSRNEHGERQDLVAHLKQVADLAAGYAAPLGAAEMARFLGLWHDIGKFDQAFQRYLLTSEANPRHREHVDHKAAGAGVAQQHQSILSLLMRGHHGGLGTPGETQTWLEKWGGLPGSMEARRQAERALSDLQPIGELSFPDWALRDPTAAELFLRLLFSALVDADFLDTERHMRPGSSVRRGGQTDLAELWERFERDQGQLSGKRGDPVGEARHAIYQTCLAAAEDPPGIFRLTVPTGGGKTRAAMGFALRHALRHGHERIIVAVPYISITEQTADVYRYIFETAGDRAPVVLEHHSAVTPAEGEEFEPEQIWSRLSAENWDARIVVTTTVQLFESLFAKSTSRCRKLHRLARSVIILDEAQALPPRLLTPILDVLQQLSAHYGTTVVISTATQPTFDVISAFAAVQTREIVPDPGRFFAVLKRVAYEWRTDPALSWAEVAALMREEPQVLAILNTKKDALALLDALDDPMALHLSTLLCGAHRRRVIADVRLRLAAGEPCRVVSTQVVEAGVDFDFPLVLRAMGPLDGIIQAGGRCNREGLLTTGRVIVFQPCDGSMPRGAYSIGHGLAVGMLKRGAVDLDDPGTIGTYFRELFPMVKTDRGGIQQLRARLDYPKTASEFRMIDESTSVVVTQYGTAEERKSVRDVLERLRIGTAEAGALLRRLQPYLVSMEWHRAQRLERQGLILPVMSGLGEWMGDYDRVCGLVGQDPEPDALII